MRGRTGPMVGIGWRPESSSEVRIGANPACRGPNPASSQARLAPSAHSTAQGRPAPAEHGVPMTRPTGTRTPEELVSAVFTDEWPAVVARALASVRDGAEAEDLAQESFLRLLEMARRGMWPTTPAAWLQRVVANLAISRHRHAAVVARNVDQARRSLVAQSGAVDPARIAADREQAAAVARILGALEPDRRTATLLAAAGYSRPEIAMQLERTPAAVRTLLCRARRSLRSDVAAALAG